MVVEKGKGNPEILLHPRKKISRTIQSMNHRVPLPNSNKAFKYNDLQKPNLVNFHLDDHRVLLRNFYPSTDNSKVVVSRGIKKIRSKPLCNDNG